MGMLRPGLFLLALLCFLMPFLQLSCNNQPYARLKGTDLVFGTSDTTRIDTSFRIAFRTELSQQKDSKDSRIQPVPQVIASFACAVLAMLIVLLMRGRNSRWLGGGLGFISFLLLALYYFTEDYSTQGDGGDFGISVQTRFLFGYWLTLVLLLIATIAAIIPRPGSRSETASEMNLEVPPPLDEDDVSPGSEALPPGD